MLFAFVLAEQIGLPIPAVPLLLGVGAFAGADPVPPRLPMMARSRPAAYFHINVEKVIAYRLRSGV